MSIWAELLPDLEDLDAYGGGPYEVEDQVWELCGGPQSLNSQSA